MTKEQKQRARAHDVARIYKALGIHPEDFLGRVRSQDFCEEELEDCLALDERGELEHLVKFVWTWKR